MRLAASHSKVVQSLGHREAMPGAQKTGRTAQDIVLAVPPLFRKP